MASMPLQEVGYRLHQVACIFHERMLGLPHDAVYARSWGDEKAWQSFCGDTAVHFYWKQAKRFEVTVNVLLNFPEGYQSSLQSAESLITHRINIFGLPKEYEVSVDWHRDPLTSHTWPMKFWAEIDQRDGHTIGGVKWVWEVNRHHHLVTLAKSYFLTGDEHYSSEALTQISSWIDQNPPLMGINWTSSLELAIRLINWAWVLGFIRGSQSLSETIFHKIQHSIVQQATYILRHLSAYSSANNHRVGEAAGLAIVSMTFPWLMGAERWKRTGLEILNHEITNLILPDGSAAEQAPHYLLFIMDFYILVMRLAELNQVTLDPTWEERLKAAARFLQIMMDKQGRIPSIGDDDDAWVVRLDDRPDANNYWSVMATTAAWFQVPSLKSTQMDWDEKSWWLLGEEGKKAFENLVPAERHPVSQILRAGGYCVMESASSKVVMDFGPLGFGTMAAHGHADSLSIWASLDGEEILVDSGTFAYQEGGIWRSYFRSTAAHNTVCVDGLNQSEMLGPFLWGKKANTKLLHWEIQKSHTLVAAEHNGYKNLGVIHLRSVLFFQPDILAICDNISGSGNHKIEQNWHMHPKCRVEISNRYALLRFGQKCFGFEVLTSPLEKLIVVKGQLDPIQGWFSNNYGVKEPAYVLSHYGANPLPVQIISIFYNKGVSEKILENTKRDIQNIFSKGIPG